MIQHHRLQLNAAFQKNTGSLFQCRTRQVVGCNNPEKLYDALYERSFNAARGK